MRMGQDDEKATKPNVQRDLVPITAKRLILLKRANPRDDDDFEVLENVAIQLPPDNRPMTVIWCGDSMRVVRTDRIWEVEFGPESLPYTMIRQATLVGIELSGVQVKKMIAGYRDAAKEDSRRDVG